MPLATFVTFEINFDPPTHHYKPIKAPLIHRLWELLHEGRSQRKCSTCLVLHFPLDRPMCNNSRNLLSRVL